MTRALIALVSKDLKLFFTDRRAVELESIEFVGNGGSVPVLLAISGVIEW